MARYSIRKTSSLTYIFDGKFSPRRLGLNNMRLKTNSHPKYIFLIVRKELESDLTGDAKRVFASQGQNTLIKGVDSNMGVENPI